MGGGTPEAPHSMVTTWSSMHFTYPLQQPAHIIFDHRRHHHRHHTGRLLGRFAHPTGSKPVRGFNKRFRQAVQAVQAPFIMGVNKLKVWVCWGEGESCMAG